LLFKYSLSTTEHLSCDNFEEVKNFFQNRESTTEKLSAKNTILMPETANFSEKTKIILRSDDEERVFYVDKDDTFADILEEADLVKIKYNGIPVSKYLTLEEIGFVENNPYFELIDTTCSDINLKVNVDFYACYCKCPYINNYNLLVFLVNNLQCILY